VGAAEVGCGAALVGAGAEVVGVELEQLIPKARVKTRNTASTHMMTGNRTMRFTIVPPFKFLVGIWKSDFTGYGLRSEIFRNDLDGRRDER